MYDIKQFKPVLYVLLVLGISGFALAAQSPAMWVLAMSAILLNAWLVRTGRFAPLPRLLSNLITLVALLYAFVTWKEGGSIGSFGSSPILVIGQFLVLLQVVKLFEQRGNRDYAQLLVLSLLLMVAAAISTATLLFGILFIVYLFMALYACLLFHLKVETDHAKVAIGLPDDKINPMTLRQDQRYLSRSMRRLTVLVSIVSVSTAILVFVFFPRGTGANMLGPLQYRPTQRLTGFSDQVSFQQVAQITQNPHVVAYVKIWDHGKEVSGAGPLVLRGATLDLYTGNTRGLVQWQWQRSPSVSAGEFLSDRLEANMSVNLDTQSSNGPLRQEIMLEPTGTETIFALAGVTDFRTLMPTPFETRLRYQPRDQTMRLEPAQDRTLRYEVFSDGHLNATPGQLPLMSNPRSTSRRATTRDIDDADESRLTRSVVDPQIEAYARRPEVSGQDGQGLLIERRPRDQIVTALDERIAANIEAHLKGNDFSYTLDLSDARRVLDRDPVVAFLYELKRGHCEYFAGAMTLMCQSLGLQARLVVGFKCDEYNNMTHTYVVRQSHAHAWVEVLNDKLQWVSFDPTSGRDISSARQTGLWAKVKQLMGFLEYTWANSVVAYDKDSRANLIQNVETRLGNTTESSISTVKQAREWINLQDRLDKWFSSAAGAKIITFLIIALLIALFGFVGWFLFERWRMQRRARRIGLNTLPRDERLKLARQLGFYDELQRLLARHRITSPANLTPMEFSHSLSFLPNELFDTVQRLTSIFYRVRYGQQQLSTVQQRRLRGALERVESTLQRLKLPAARPSRHT